MTRQGHERMSAALAHGPEAESVQVEKIALPVPGPGEALLAVEAAAITADELTWPDHRPFVPAHDVAGRVVGLGEGAGGVGVGDAVYGLVGFDRPGAASAYVVVPAADLAPRPSVLGPVRAAAVPLGALTAWQALVVHAQLRAGQHVLVHGGAGGVGHFAVQIAAALGARVTATASSRDLAFVSSLGADKVIDYASRFEDHVAGVDVVLDTVGGDVLKRSWRVLIPGGLLVGVAERPDPSDPAAADRRGLYFVVEPSGPQLRQISSLIEAGRLRPTVGRVFGLDEAAAALACQRDEHVRGKIALEAGPFASERETTGEVTAWSESAERAMKPEDLTRLFVDRANGRDAGALAGLYEEGAVVAFPPGQVTKGRPAIRQLYEGMLTHAARFEPEPSLPALHAGDIALTATRRRDGSGLRVQVVRRQPDGAWLRVIDWPEPSDTPS